MTVRDNWIRLWTRYWSRESRRHLRVDPERAEFFAGNFVLKQVDAGLVQVFAGLGVDELW